VRQFCRRPQRDFTLRFGPQNAIATPGAVAAAATGEAINWSGLDCAAYQHDKNQELAKQLDFSFFDLTLAGPAVTLGTTIFRKTAHGSKSVGGKKAVLLCCATMMKPTQRRCCSKERSRESTSPRPFF
jgi:hypothetical protein